MHDYKQRIKRKQKPQTCIQIREQLLLPPVTPLKRKKKTFSTISQWDMTQGVTAFEGFFKQSSQVIANKED